MRTIGILGGMSWESTAKYYQVINKVVYERLGGLNSARMILYSFNFDQISKLQKKGSWAAAGEELAGQGARGVILGCTEISMLIGPGQTSIPLFDTTEIHACRAAELALLQ